MFETIKKEIKSAEADKQKFATFQYHVLMNTENGRNASPKEFCKEVGVKESYTTAFADLIAVARVMESRGIRLPELRRFGRCFTEHSADLDTKSRDPATNRRAAN
jgi:hypothetical protein